LGPGVKPMEIKNGKLVTMSARGKDCILKF
jgi:hypothetical protein